MVISRKVRIELLKKDVEKQWNTKYINFLLKCKEKINENPETLIAISLDSHNITTDLIENTPDFDFNLSWNNLAFNRAINIDFVLRHKQKFIDIGGFAGLSCNPSIKIEDIENNMDLPWDFQFVSRNPNLTTQFIENNGELNWAWASIYSNPSVGLDFIECVDWNCAYHGRCISQNPKLTIKLVKDYPNIKWCMKEVSLNPNIFPEDIDNNPELHWDWRFVAMNPNITFDFVKKHKNKPFNWFMISLRDNINMKMIQENPDILWDWTGVSRNPNITLEIILKNLDKPWNWVSLHSNPSMKLEWIDYLIEEGYMSKEDHYSCISLNFHLKLDDIINDINKEWDWSAVIINPHTNEKNEFFDRKYKEHIASYRIQQYYIKSKTDPNYSLCQKKINNDYTFYSNFLENTF